MGNETHKSNECYNFPGIIEFLKKYTCIISKQHGRRHKKSSNNKVKPGGDSFKTNPHHEHNCKATHDKKQGGAQSHDLEKATLDKKQDGAQLHNLEKVSQSGNGMEELNKMRKLRSIDEREMKTTNICKTPSLERTTSVGNRSSRDDNVSLNRSTSGHGQSPSDTPVKLRKMRTVSKSGPAIMFSNSSGMLKPPPSEEQLECTLEELCLGCVKYIKVSRSVYNFSGRIMHQDEVLKVRVRPGWRTGTKITFKGTVNEDKRGQIPGDIIFIITEKRHPLFRRIEDDDLELELEIPLVDALTGCNLSIPLLGKPNMSMEINEIIYPGYQKIIVGEGMPNPKNPNQKGNLRVKFLVAYPNNLTDEQRSELSGILSD